MKINIIPNEKETHVCLIGELDTTVTTTQVEDLNQVLALADKALEIDCEELEYISSAGLRFFMQLVNDIFRMSGFQNLFTIE